MLIKIWYNDKSSETVDQIWEINELKDEIVLVRGDHSCVRVKKDKMWDLEVLIEEVHG